MLCEGAFGRQQKMRDMGVDKLFQSMLIYSDPDLTEVYVYQVQCFFSIFYRHSSRLMIIFPTHLHFAIFVVSGSVFLAFF